MIQFKSLYEDFNKLKRKNPQLKTLLSIGGASAGIEKFRKLIPLIIMRINKIDNGKFFEKEGKASFDISDLRKNKEKLKLNRP